MPPPTVLIIGATGNTGRSVVRTLSQLSQSPASSTSTSTSTSTNPLSTHRILALTRSANSPAAQKLAQLPNVEIAEQNWIEITPSWLRAQNIVRAFVASHNEPTQFADESTFYVSCLAARVEYIVRTSTGAPNVRPDSKAYYPRSHWAIESLLAAPEFEALKWTSLQPNLFSGFVQAPAVRFIKEWKMTAGNVQGPLKLLVDADAPVGMIDENEVGAVAARLLALDDPSTHNKAKYVLNGPEDITGAQIVQLVEKHIGAKVENVVFKDTSVFDAAVGTTPYSKNVVGSKKFSMEVVWDGKMKAETTSRQVLEIAAPRRTPAECLESLLVE